MTGTTADRATARRAQQAARQRDAAARRRGQRVPGSAPDSEPPPKERITVVSFVEPPETAWAAAAAAAASKPQPVAPARRADVRVTLELPGEGLTATDRTIVLTDDPAEMLDHLMFVMSVGGWRSVADTFTKLCAAEKGLGPVADTCLVQAQVMVNRLRTQLRLVEQAARRLTLQHLELGAAQVESATQTFLTGWPDLSAVALQENSYIRGKVRLNPGAHVTELRRLLRDLGPLNARVREAARPYASVARYLEDPERLAVQEVTIRYHAAQLARANRIAAVSTRWPIVAWLTHLPPEPTDEDILEAVVEQIVVVVESIAAVREAVRAGSSWPIAAGVDYDPAIGTPPRQTTPGSRRAPTPPTLAPRTFRRNPFTANMSTPRGPWLYPKMIALALEHGGHDQYSPLAGAARDVLGGSEAFGLGIMLGVGTGAVGVASGPVGVGLGLAMSAWNLWMDWQKYQADATGYRAMLDPAWAIHVEPSIRGVIAGVIGVVAEAVPGKKALGLVGAEAVIRMTGP